MSILVSLSYLYVRKNLKHRSSITLTKARRSTDTWLDGSKPKTHSIMSSLKSSQLRQSKRRRSLATRQRQLRCISCLFDSSFRFPVFQHQPKFQLSLLDRCWIMTGWSSSCNTPNLFTIFEKCSLLSLKSSWERSSFMSMYLCLQSLLWVSSTTTLTSQRLNR